MVTWRPRLRHLLISAMSARKNVNIRMANETRANMITILIETLKYRKLSLTCFNFKLK